MSLGFHCFLCRCCPLLGCSLFWFLGVAGLFCIYKSVKGRSHNAEELGFFCLLRVTLAMAVSRVDPKNGLQNCLSCACSTDSIQIQGSFM